MLLSRFRASRYSLVMAGLVQACPGHPRLALLPTLRVHARHRSSPSASARQLGAPKPLSEGGKAGHDEKTIVSAAFG
jgi:hypothetical protein